MTWAKALYSGPSEAAVSFADARDFLRLPDDGEAVIVSDLITAATAKVESDTGRLLCTQTWDLYCDAFPKGLDPIELPLQPLQSVTSIQVTSLAGVQSTLATSVYQVDAVSIPPRITLADGQCWPTDLRATHGIVIRVVVGYASGSIPAPLALAIKQLVSQWYAVRTAAGAPLPPPWMGYDALIAPYRCTWGIG